MADVYVLMGGTHTLEVIIGVYTTLDRAREVQQEFTDYRAQHHPNSHSNAWIEVHRLNETQAFSPRRLSTESIAEAIIALLEAKQD